MEHNKPNWDKLQAISVLTSDSPQLGPALKKNPYIYICVPPANCYQQTEHENQAAEDIIQQRNQHLLLLGRGWGRQ